MLVLIPVFLELSMWQFHRLDGRRQANHLLLVALEQPPTPFEQVLTKSDAGAAQISLAEWTPVVLRGAWVTGSTVLARRHWRGDRVGHYVIDPFQLNNGPVVPVARGWMAPAEADNKAIGALAPPRDQAVSLVGWVRRYESPSCPSDLPKSQIAGVNPGCLKTVGWDTSQLAAVWVQVDRGRTLDNDLWLSPNDGESVLDIPPPEITEGSHLSYAWQWRLFALLSVVGWIILVRTEQARERQIAPHI